MRLFKKVLIKKVLIALLLAGLVMFVVEPWTVQTSVQASKDNTATLTSNVTTTPTFTPTLHGRPVDIYFNDRPVTWGDALPFIQPAPPYRTMVPIRFFSETIGAEVSWNQTEKEVTVKLDAAFTYDHVAREVKLWVGSDQAQVTLGDKVKTVVLDASVYQETEYPWRTFAPLRFITEGLGGEVRWAGVGSPSLIFPKKILSQDEVCITYFFPVREEDYLIVPGERYGRFELRWSAQQMIKEAKATLIYEDDSRRNYVGDAVGFVVFPGKGVSELGEEYHDGTSPYHIVEGISVGSHFDVNNPPAPTINGVPFTVKELRYVNGEFAEWSVDVPGLTIRVSPDKKVKCIYVLGY